MSKLSDNWFLILIFVIVAFSSCHLRVERTASGGYDIVSVSSMGCNSSSEKK